MINEIKLLELWETRQSIHILNVVSNMIKAKIKQCVCVCVRVHVIYLMFIEHQMVLILINLIQAFGLK